MFSVRIGIRLRKLGLIKLVVVVEVVVCGVSIIGCMS